MSTIEKLRAAHAAATPGEWIKGSPQEPNMAYVGTGDGGWLGLAALYGDTDEEAHANAAFIAIAHNHMSDLLEAVELLDMALHALETPGDFTPDEMQEQVIGDIARHLAKLKGTQS